MTQYRPIPYGITDFPRIRNMNYYYVDKTAYIPMMELDARYIFFLRPRRFGKSLLLSMLECYYDVRKADQFDALFKDLYIHSNPTKEQGKYLILKFNFSSVDPNPEKVQASFNHTCLLNIRLFVSRYAEYLPSETMEYVSKEQTFDASMAVLMEYVQRTSYKIYLMIDEYDNFVNAILSSDSDSAYDDGFFRLFFNKIKAYTTGTDSPVSRIFITGVSPITLSDVTSGFNIGRNISMISKYNGLVGFSETQVREMLNYYRGTTGVFNHTIDQLIEIMKPWYDNYCFSYGSIDDDRMFNSVMVLYFVAKYVKHGKIPESMVDPNVSIDLGKMQKIIRFESSFGPKSEMIQRLLVEGKVCTSIVPEFSLSDMDNPTNLYSLLYYLGMLTYGGKDYGRPILSIPNQVVREQYYKYLLLTYNKTIDYLPDIGLINRLVISMTKNGEWKPYFQYLADQLKNVSSIRDYIQGEIFVKAFLLSNMIYLQPVYDIKSESADIVITPRNFKATSYLVEIKYCKAGSSDSVVEQLRSDAFDQLEQYAAGMDDVCKIVLVFRSWEMVICDGEYLG